MTYEEIRKSAEDGDLIFLSFDKGNILSRITSFTTQSMFTHVAILFWYRERSMLVESTTHGGLRVVNASVYKDRDISMLKAPKPWWQISDRALSRIGTVKYGWFSSIYIGIRDVLHRYFDWHLPPNAGNRNMACSEFVSLVLELEDSDIPPRQLYEILNGKAERTGFGA
jgi:hypothetical protein